MRVLVTGAGGFVGPHLLRALAAAGHEAHGLVHRRGGAVAGTPASLHEGDVLDGGALERLLAAVSPDGIVHLASRSHVGEAERDPETTYLVNVGGTLAVLGAVRAAAPAARVLVVGSGDAYGAVEPHEIPITEDVPLRPRTVYGASKAAADVTAGQWARGYGLDVVRVRAFNHTGPGQTPRFVCSSFARQVAEIEAGRSEPVLRVGNLDPVRDFSDVRDVAAGYVAILERGRPRAVYNLCSGEGRTIQSVVDLFAGLSRVPLEVRRDPARVRPVEVPRFVGSHERMTADTGWRPTIPFEQTATDLLDWWRGS